MPGATSYRVYWGTNSGVTTGSEMLDPTTTTDYGHTSVVRGYTYYYKVAAVNSSGESPLSAEASAYVPLDSGSSISGQITAGGTGISGITINLNGPVSRVTATDPNGNYSFSGLTNGNYIVIPAMPGDTFSPTSQPVQISGGDYSSVNFRVYPVITSLSPSSHQAGTFDLTIYGRYLTAGTDDRIYKSSDGSYVGSGGTVNSSITHLTSTERITEPGTYVVKVINLDGFESNGVYLVITNP